MNLPSPSQLRRCEELLDQLADASPAEREKWLASETDQRVVRLVRMADWWAEESLEELPRGFQVNGIKLIEKLGAGGMGVVYRGRQESLNREVAVKFIRPELLAQGPATAQRLLQAFDAEIARLANLRHDGITAVYTGGRQRLHPRRPEVPWFAMEFLAATTRLIPEPGTQDADRHAKWLPDESAKLRCFQKVCEAVAHAHQRGVMHLDLTPANVLVMPDGQPKVIDFGLAEVVRAERPHMPWLIGRGTLLYMAPEQLNSTFGSVSQATDVHALGVLLYQLLTGQLPYPITNATGNDAEEFRHLICYAERKALPAPLAKQYPELKTALENALKQRPDARQIDAAELATKLQRLTNRGPLPRRRASRPDRSVIAKNYQVTKDSIIHIQNNRFH